MIQVLYLGRMDYDAAQELQKELVGLRIEGRIENTLLLLEHPPVLTLGRNANRAHVLATDEMLAQRGVRLHETNRGGEVTYHGPGQLVGYPIFDLRSLRNSRGSRLGPVDFVRMMEEALIRTCAEYGVAAGQICGLTGVWSAAQGGPLDKSCDTRSVKSTDAPKGERKIAAIGIHVSRSVTSHGFAFNVTTDLRDFGLIVPCGISDRGVTSLEAEYELAGKTAETLPTLESVAYDVARQFGAVFGEQMLALEDVETLRELARGRSEAKFPAQDTPLQVPREVERLHGEKDRPLSA